MSTDNPVRDAEEYYDHLEKEQEKREYMECGRPGEIHHVDAIGMGRDRTKVDDSGSRKICLCRTHHTIAHTKGMDRFEQMYHVYGIVIKDV